ncbi:MAG: hypothetical protein JSW11_20480 [Candidatus Heimdallarchaeota archaeon]|nr:MAG: hypothetical protein JSW11_20480 [Candidatus Heimdallarchaeota archaeon]
MNKEPIIIILETTGLLALVAALIIFIIIIYLEIKRNNLSLSSHSFFIILLLICWLVVELLSPWLFGSNSLLEHLTHSFLLIILAVWINLRFYWAHKKAREISDLEWKIQIESYK